MSNAENDLLTGILVIFMQSYLNPVNLNRKVNINSV
jgi:hypothetical protein